MMLHPIPQGSGQEGKGFKQATTSRRSRHIQESIEMSECPDKLANRADSTMEMIAEIERLQERDREQGESLFRFARATLSHADALQAIIERSENGELGTSKVIDMANIARAALGDRHE